MSEDDSERPQVMRVQVRKGATEEEKKAAIGKEVFNQMVSKIVEERASARAAI